MLKLLVADDHRVLREGLRRIIEHTRDMVVVSEASDGADVLSKLSKVRVDVVLLDISMPGPSGIEVLKQVKARFPKLPVLVLSQHPESLYAIRSLRAGAAGYLTKESAASELITAIRKVAVGGRYVSESAAEQMAMALDSSGAGPLHESLSDREFEILCLLGSGQTVSEIAKGLSLSVKTISTYRTRILEKMTMKKTSELMLYVIQNRLAPIENNARP